jgi:O-antigen/teichoic acid export membrane protein
MIIDAGTEPTPTIQAAAPSGLRAGVVVLMGVVALNAGNYLFHVITARRLGPERYGDLATLLTLSSLISLPLGGVQVWVARYIAQRRAIHHEPSIRWFVRRFSLYLSIAGVGILLLFAALAWPIKQGLGIASVSAVVITAATVFPAFVTPLTWGLAQGLERFGLVALAYASGPVARLVLLFAGFAAGLGVSGAMLATLGSMIIALLVPAVDLRSWWRPAPGATRDLYRAEALRSLLPVMVGLLAITALTSDDVVVAKAALSGHDAGIYGSASLMGRVILYLPAAIITVMLPRVAARSAENAPTESLLYRSAAATVTFSALGTVAYALIGTFVTRVAFGTDYTSAGRLLWLFGVAMTVYALLNVLLIYHLGRDDPRMSWLLLVGAVAQILLFAVVHGSPHQLIAIDALVAVGLLAAHEVLIDATLTRRVAAFPATAFARRR